MDGKCELFSNWKCVVDFAIYRWTVTYRLIHMNVRLWWNSGIKCYANFDWIKKKVSVWWVSFLFIYFLFKYYISLPHCVFGNSFRHTFYTSINLQLELKSTFLQSATSIIYKIRINEKKLFFFVEQKLYYVFNYLNNTRVLTLTLIWWKKCFSIYKYQQNCSLIGNNNKSKFLKIISNTHTLWISHWK